jgi:hypothetical protein
LPTKKASKTTGQTKPEVVENAIPVTEITDKVDLSKEVQTVPVLSEDKKISKFDAIIAGALIIGLPILVYLLITGM